MAVDVEFLNGNNVNNINNNFQRVKNALQEVVGRNGNLPNHMNADLDMNSNDILNVDRIDLQRIVVDGEDFDLRQMRGWAPVFSAIEYNGTVVMKLIDYVGGQGIKPTQYIGWYVGSTGYVQNINQATGFGSSGVTDGDKGDVVVSSSGSVWTAPRLPTESRAWAIANFHPISAPTFIHTAGYGAPGDGGGALYKLVVSEPSHAGKFSITLDDGVTAVWYEIAESAIRWEQLGVFAATTVSGTAFQAPFDAGIAVGASDFILPSGDITITGPVVFTVPVDYGDVRIKGRGNLSFQYDWDYPANISTNLITLQGNGADSFDVDLSVNGQLMGRWPNQPRAIFGTQLLDAPRSKVRWTGREIHGYGLVINGSESVEIICLDAFNCDGQLYTPVVGGPFDGLFDSYGDALYIGSSDCVVIAPKIVTTNGGRAGIVFESFDSRFSGTVINPLIIGYDRAIHAEGVASAGEINVIGGRIKDSNIGGWSSAQSTCVYDNVEFSFAAQVSVRVLAIEVQGYLSSVANCRIVSRNCRFKANAHPDVQRTIFTGGTHISDGDIFEFGAGGVDASNAALLSIEKPTGRSAGLINAFNSRLIIRDGSWAGSIDAPASNKVHIENMDMNVPTGGTYCGTISMQQKSDGIVQNVRFTNPETHCVNNYRIGASAALGPLPIFQRIIAIRNTVGSVPAPLLHTPSDGNHNYRAYEANWIIDNYVGNQSEGVLRTTG